MKKPTSMNDSTPLYSKKAVALRYDPEKDEAPVVVAKGKGRVAEKIMEAALEHGVPIQEDASLVEILSKLDLDDAIPPELYQIVAEILSFVYRSDRKAQDIIQSSTGSRGMI